MSANHHANADYYGALKPEEPKLSKRRHRFAFDLDHVDEVRADISINPQPCIVMATVTVDAATQTTATQTTATQTTELTENIDVAIATQTTTPKSTMRRVDDSVCRDCLRDPSGSRHPGAQGSRLCQDCYAIGCAGGRPYQYRDESPEYATRKPAKYRDESPEYATRKPAKYRDESPEYTTRKPAKYRDESPEYATYGTSRYRDVSPEYGPAVARYESLYGTLEGLFYNSMSFDTARFD